MGFAKKFKKMKEDDAKKLFEELKSLELATLADEHIAQIVDILPKDLADLKAVFAGSKTTLTPENFQKIQDIVAKYRK